MDSVIETLFDGTEAHGFLEVAKPLEMQAPGIGSDFFSKDPIFALFVDETFCFLDLELSVVIESPAKASNSTVCHFVSELEPCAA